MRIVLAADHAGFELKQSLKDVLRAQGHEVEDLGTDSEAPCDYPDLGHALAEGVANTSVPRGVLVCGTGVGMSMVANRHAGVRAVVCSEPFSARMARRHNDANVLCLGARVIGLGLAFDILDAFLNTEFEGGRHQLRLDKLDL